MSAIKRGQSLFHLINQTGVSNLFFQVRVQVVNSQIYFKVEPNVDHDIDLSLEDSFDQFFGDLFGVLFGDIFAFF